MCAVREDYVICAVCEDFVICEDCRGPDAPRWPLARTRIVRRGLKRELLVLGAREGCWCWTVGCRERRSELRVGRTVSSPRAVGRGRYRLSGERTGPPEGVAVAERSGEGRRARRG